jgi:hypothetical protein
MLAGALLLLAVSVFNGPLDGGLPGWLTFALNYCGYGFLAVGFVLAMRSFSEREAAKKKRPKE